MALSSSPLTGLSLGEGRNLLRQENILMSLAWMPFYPNDFLGDTLGLTAEEVGAYVLLICAYWNNGGPLPSDPVLLKRIIRSPKRASHILPQVLLHFTVSGDQITHQRIDFELNKASISHAKRVHAGRLAHAKHKQCTVQPQPQPQPSISINKVAVQIPEDWMPSEKETAYANSEGINRSDIKRIADHFRDYHIAKGNTFNDIGAAWRNWVRNHKRFERPSGTHKKNGGLVAALSANLAEIEVQNGPRGERHRGAGVSRTGPRERSERGPRLTPPIVETGDK